MVMKKIDVIIIGSGSIALRHYKIYVEMGLNVGIFSPTKERKDWLEENQFNLVKLENISCEIGVVCSFASRHIEDIKHLESISNSIIVEKPLLSYQDFIDKSNYDSSKKIIVGFNKRFERGIQEMRKIVFNQNSEIESSSMICLSDLQNWRSKDKRDLKDSISLQFHKGGGVLNELSHEIDLCEFFAGKIESQYGYKWKSKFRESLVEDSASLIIKHENKQNISHVNISFASPIETRISKIVYKNGSQLVYDHMTNNLQYSRKGKIVSSEIFNEHRNESFKRQIKALLKYGTEYSDFCSFERGLYYSSLNKNILWLP